MTIDVSFIIPVYNGEAVLGKAIRSALIQSDITAEIIVLDDGSTKSHQHIIDTFPLEQDRIVFRRFDQNRGPGAMRNIAISLARGDYISVLDADDYIEKKRSRILLDIAQQSSADIIVDNLIEEEIGAKNQSIFFDLGKLSFKNGYETITLDDFMQSGQRGFITPSLGYTKPLFKRSTLMKMEIQYNENIIIGEDYYFVSELLSKGCHMVMTAYQGYHYTRHANSISHRLSPSAASKIISTQEEFKKKHFKIWTPTLETAHQKRLKIFEDMKYLETFIQHIKKKEYSVALRHTICTPYKIPLLIKKMWGIGLGKIKSL